MSDGVPGVGLELAVGVAPAASVRLAEIEDRVRRSVSAGRATSTIRAYRSDFSDFSTWCGMLGLSALPASPGSVAGYLSELGFPPDDREPATVSTLSRRLSAISQAHSLAGLGNPCSDPLVRETMRGLRRTLGVAPRPQKRAVTTAEIRTAVTELGESLIELRDRVVLLVGFAGGMRRSELAGLCVGDVEDATEGLLIHLRRSKTDQEGRGRRVEVVYGTDPVTCPVRAYRAWIEAARLDEGPVLHRVDRHGNILGPLSPQGVAIIVKRHIGRLGLPASDFAGHSLGEAMPPLHLATGRASGPSWQRRATPRSRPCVATSMMPSSSATRRRPTSGCRFGPARQCRPGVQPRVARGSSVTVREPRRNR